MAYGRCNVVGFVQFFMGAFRFIDTSTILGSQYLLAYAQVSGKLGAENIYALLDSHHYLVE